MKKLIILIYAILCTGIFSSNGQIPLKLEYSFDSVGGMYPLGSLTASGNVLYGMTQYGGANKAGCIFFIDTNGSGFKDIFDFKMASGQQPSGSLILSGNTLYGMTGTGGAHNYGTVFSINTNGGGFVDLLDFKGTNGGSPEGSLILSGNVLYGMTSQGGASGYGNIFSINTNGSSFTDLLDFNKTNGANPAGSLILSGNTLFGMTFYGGVNNDGCIFSIKTNGSGYKKLLDFNITNGQSPNGDLIISGMVLYGMTQNGGAHGNGVVFSIDTDGTAYKDLFDFNTGNPTGSLTLLNNVLYGMVPQTASLIFSINTDGSGWQPLIVFGVPANSNPWGSLALDGNEFFLMTRYGGDMSNWDGHGYGAIYGFNDLGLGINEVLAGNSIEVFPNPSNGSFTFTLSKLSEKNRVEIYNIVGEKIFSQTLSERIPNIINLIGQPNGVYLYKVLKLSGDLVESGKLIIEK